MIYMKYLYLDTAQFLKWQNQTLDKATIKHLNNISERNDFLFVISDIHGIEIANKSERWQVIEDFKFLQDKRCVEILPSLELFRCEILHALSVFEGKQSIMIPFTPIAEDYFSPKNVDKMLLSYQNLQKERYRLITYIKSNSSKACNAADIPSKGIFKKNLSNKFRERLLLEIGSANINLSNKDAFVNFIMKNPSLMPSLKLNFYALAYYFRNAKTKSVEINDWLDILHMNAAPYVDYFSGDREACTRLQNTSKAINVKIKAQVGPRLLTLLVD